MTFLTLVIIALVVYLAFKSDDQQRQINELRGRIHSDIKSHPAYDMFE